MLEEHKGHLGMSARIRESPVTEVARALGEVDPITKRLQLGERIEAILKDKPEGRKIVRFVVKG